MSAPPTKRHHVTREEEADRDLNGTQFSKGSAILVALFFLCFVFGVPIIQHFVEIKGNMAKRAEWKPESGQPMPGLAPKIYEVFGLLPTGKDISAAKGFWGYWGLIPATETINEFDDELKQQSVLTQALLSPAQDVLTGILGVGNEKAYCGKPGWLFYRPDVEYLTSDGFLDPAVLRMRSHQATAAQPDPVKAIVDFNAQLKDRQIQLVVVPVPTKPMIHPEMLVGEGADKERLQNPSFAEFKRRLDAAGVLMYDPTDLLLGRKAETGEKQYLETDTHWTPDAMSAVSKALAAFIESHVQLGPLKIGPYYEKPVPVSNLGDIAEMLKLPKGQTIYKPQSVVDQQIIHDEQPVTSDKKGDVLLLGDSFSNIYSLGGMNWGESAGFAEHLSKDLSRPVDKIVINSGGSIKTRSDLARDMYRSDRLAGKKVVIYEFSMRDLSQGDWKLIELPKPKASPVPTPTDTHVAIPPKATAEIRILSESPATVDLSKHQIAHVKFFAPAGKWSAVIRDKGGKTVLSLPRGEGADAPARFDWDGSRQDGKPVEPGAFAIAISGVRPDGTKLKEQTVSVIVTGAKLVLEAVGATPSIIDPTAGQSATSRFIGPNTGDYVASVLDARQKEIRVLGKQAVKAGVISVKWDGKDAKGKPVPDGKYRVQLADREDSQQAGIVSTVVQVKSAVKTTPTTNPNPPHPSPNTNVKPPAETELTVTGRIASRAPQPKAGAYKDAVIALHLADLKVTGGKIGNGDILVYVWGMRDNNLTDGAYQVGATVTFHLIPWDKAEGKYGSFNRLELENDDYYSWPTYWGENKK